MGKRFITALLALLLVGAQVFAQSAVSGKVTDETGEPCVGANVLIKGTTTGTMTDFDGNYSLPHVKQGAILSYLKHWLHHTGSQGWLLGCHQCSSPE